MVAHNWLKAARQRGVHPYVTSFLDLNPHMWKAEAAGIWDAASEQLSELDLREVGLDSEVILYPLLVKELGPTGGAMFFGFCQQQLTAFPPDAVFRGIYDGCSTSPQTIVPLLDGCLYVMFYILADLNKRDPDAENWARHLGTEGCAAINAFWRWVKLYVKGTATPARLSHILSYGHEELRTKLSILLRDQRLEEALGVVTELVTEFEAHKAKVGG